MGANTMKYKVDDMRTQESGARQAANAIVQLINSRPRSPCFQEIEAIIEKLAVRPSRHDSRTRVVSTSMDRI